MSLGETLQEAIETPVPLGDDDELVIHEVENDSWEIVGSELIRHHRVQRLKLFFSHDTAQCPVPIEALLNSRTTVGQYVSGGQFSRQEEWRVNLHSHIPQPELWTGTTKFSINPKWTTQPTQ